LKKKLEERVSSKNVRKFITLSLLAAFLFSISTTVLANSDSETITTACELKSGLLFAFGDGFSNLKKCPKTGRLVEIIGQRGPRGEQGEPGSPGLSGAEDIAFIDYEDGEAFVLYYDGRVFQMTEQGLVNLNRDVPVDVETILQWNILSFLDNNGDIWWWDSDSWENIGSP
jgi:hypothetical protein